jgi:hypothetical protein
MNNDDDIHRASEAEREKEWGSSYCRAERAVTGEHERMGRDALPYSA